MNTLNLNQKQRLRDYIIRGANQYSRFLCNKNFLLLCEDGSLHTVRFVKKEFKHLSGIASNLNASRFFELSLVAKLSVGNINTEQKYDWSTLIGKAKRLSNIQDLLYRDGEKTLLLKELQTHTTTFPVAIKNEATNICVACVSRINKGHSLRKASNSNIAQETKKIYAIFAKSLAEDKYQELIYTSDVKRLFDTNQIFVNELSGCLEMKILEILTKPN